MLKYWVRSASLLTAFLPLLLLFHSPLAAAQDTTVSGTITSYECGDNCYLTITSDSGEEHVGLCAAPECVPWNEVAEMPEDMVGVHVVAATAMGTQFDGNGDPVGEMLAFESIELPR